MSNVRRNLAVTLTAGGTNPLKLRMHGRLPYRKGTALNAALIGQGGTPAYAYSLTAGVLPTAATFTASISTTVMTVTAVANGAIVVGQPIYGTGVTAGQKVVSFGTGTGGTGTYNLSISNTLTSRAMTGTLILGALTGIITGTPSVAGSYPFTAQVQDAAVTVFSANFEMPVQHLLQPVAVTPTPIENSFALNYSYTFQVSGNTGAVTWAITSGAQPTGLTLSAGGVLSGNPAAVTGTTYNFVVTATDAGSGDALPIPVSMYMNPPIQVVSPNPITLSIGTFYPKIPVPNQVANYWPPVAQNGVPPYRYVYSVFSGPTPSWLVYNTNGDGMMSGTPDTATSPNTPIVIRIQAFDSLGVGDTMFVTINVVAPNQKLQLQKAATNVNVPGPNTLNFDGIGAASVTSDGNTASVMLGANMNAPGSSCTIPANCTAVLYGTLTLASGVFVTRASGAFLVVM